jgi:OOP family OmpA-OmpF porin
MKLIRKSGALGLVALAVIASPLAYADDSGWYLGGNVGKSRATIDDANITSNLLTGGLTVSPPISDRDSDTGYKIFGGYQFNKYLGLEGGYFDLGTFGFTANTTPLGTLNGELKLKGLNLDLVATLPITHKFSVFGRAGVTYAETSDAFTGTGSVYVLNPNPSTRESNYKYGAGLQYAFTDNLAMRLEAERYRINDAVGSKGDIDLVSLGLIYRFGAKTPAPAPRMAAPAPEPVREVVAVAPPPPPPAPPPPPPPPRFEKLTLSATELFGFDSAELRMPQPKLDEFANAMISNHEVRDVDITGYSDRIGSKKYNQKLSERRAVAVKDYLVSKGIDANRLKAVGKGEANPVVVCTDKKRPALIKCLEPNRRVEVEKITIERRVK